MAGLPRSQITYWPELQYGNTLTFITGGKQYHGRFIREDEYNLVFDNVTNMSGAIVGDGNLVVAKVSFTPVTGGRRRSKKTKKSKRSHKRRKSVRK